MPPLRSLLLFSACFCLAAQEPPRLSETDSVQKLVETLFPKSTRLKEIRMGEIVRELGIREGSQVADVGCASGEFSIVLSHIVGPQGRVYCEDIDGNKQYGLGKAKANFRQRRLRNVTLILGAPDDPKLPAAALDAVMIVNAYHEMPKYVAMLHRIGESLKPGGRLVIMDNRPNRTLSRPREKQTRNHVLSVDLAAADVAAAGFRILDRQDGFLDDPDSESAHWLIAAERPRS